MLIRHSFTEGNLRRRYIGTTDEPLCESGRELAKQAAGKIDFNVEAVYCSPLKRCVETAGILFPGIEAVIIPSLKECGFGIFEGKTHAELADDPDYIKWVASEGGFTPPGGESGADAQKRCEAALQSILNDMRTGGLTCAVAVTHGGVIMRLMEQLFGGGMYKWQPENCGGYLLETDGHAFAYKKLNSGAEQIADDISAIL